MNQHTSTDGSFTSGATRVNTDASPATAKVEDAAYAAHRVTDKIADTATERVDRLSGTVHRAVNTAADIASSVTQAASDLPTQANQIPDTARASIRERPIATVAGALFVGYLLGRLTRS